MIRKLFFLVACFILLMGCDHLKRHFFGHDATHDSIKSISSSSSDSIDQNQKQNIKDTLSAQINTGNTSPDSIINFAKTLIGTPYKYASIDPAQGFDCSGFITYVFSHFNIIVPRSSVDFTNVGKEVSVKDSKKGDIILFRGTDSTEKFVGHIGIIISNDNGGLQFIHSSSGKANGVVITPLNDYYKGRFMKVVRIFAQ